MKDNIVWIVFMLLGGIFVIIGSTICLNVFNYANTKETTGVITRIFSNDEDDRHKVAISYQINGESYESILNGYSSTYHKGKKIKIYYNIDNPNKIGVKSLDLLYLIFPGVGIFFLITGLSGLIFKIGKKDLSNKLKDTGELIYITDYEIILNTSYNYNGKNPYIIICKWQDITDGKSYEFKSKNIWEDIYKIMEEKKITQIPVYVDSNNRKKYFVDIDSVINENK